MKNVTRAKAEAVLRSVAKAFPDCSESSPELVKDWAGNAGWAIVWEDGPYEWVFQYSEMSAGYAATDAEFGFSRKPVKPIKGVYTEPFYSFVMMVYPAA